MPCVAEGRRLYENNLSLVELSVRILAVRQESDFNCEGRVCPLYFLPTAANERAKRTSAIRSR